MDIGNSWSGKPNLPLWRLPGECRCFLSGIAGQEDTPSEQLLDNKKHSTGYFYSVIAHTRAGSPVAPSILG